MNYGKHGKPPYRIVVIHGGPGAPGEMAYVAKKISENCGVIEPFQTSRTIRGQIEELHSAINEICDLPVTVIGHSWGAWLSFMLAAEFPDEVKKLIIVSAGPFDRGVDVINIRLNRLEEPDRRELLNIMGLMRDSSELNHHAFRRFGELTSKADSFDPIELEENDFEFQPEIYQSVWPEAEKLRSEGKLLGLGKQIQCPVIAIHGDYDPHRAAGVEEPLRKTLQDFKFILLKECGHYPWKEKRARDRFFEILREELDEK